MSANIDTLMYVGETPWHRLGHKYETAPSTSQEIIEGAELNWRVNSVPMETSIHGIVPGYNAIYREDNNDILGVVNNARPAIVQNTDTFRAFEDLLKEDVKVDTAASLSYGKIVFGCFKINSRYKVLDDDVEHYLVVMNEHLKPDGKVTVLNTPVRVVCQNTLSVALRNNTYKARIPVSHDMHINRELANKILSSTDKAVAELSKTAETFVNEKFSRSYLDKVMDELFPYLQVDESSMHSQANENVTLVRETFLRQCMGADNLTNYQGTNYQIFNALLDFTQHYYKNVDKAFDLGYRMNMLPGIGTDSPTSIVVKFLKIKDKISV